MGKIELKLSIYDFHIRRKNFRNNLNSNIKKNTKRQSHDNEITFENFFMENFNQIIDDKPQTKEQMFDAFSIKYIKSFNGDFKKNLNGTRAFMPLDIKKSSHKNIIYGMVEGGITGIDRTIKPAKKPKSSNKTLSKDDVAALPFYFLMWMPFDTNTGVLMIQGYTDESILGVFKQHIINFFEELEINFSLKAFVPEKYQEDFYKRSKITQVVYKKSSLSDEARNKFNPIFYDLKNMVFEIKLSKLSILPDEFFDKYKMKDGKFIGADLSDLEINDNESYETTLFYEDEKKRKAHIKLNKNVGIYPTIFLDNELKVENNEYPDLNKIHKFCSSLLIEILKEKNYNPDVI